MTDTLWHGNDDPPNDGTLIEYILGGESYRGAYYQDKTIGSFIIGYGGNSVDHDGEHYTRFYQHKFTDVSQWRLA